MGRESEINSCRACNPKCEGDCDICIREAYEQEKDSIVPQTFEGFLYD